MCDYLRFFDLMSFPCRPLAFESLTFAASKNHFMENAQYLNIFNAFEKVPLEDSLKGIFKGISAEQRKSLVLEDVSYHRLNAEVVTLEAWMCVVPRECK